MTSGRPDTHVPTADDTRRQQRWVLGLAVVFGVIGSLLLGAAAVVVWAWCGSRP